MTCETSDCRIPFFVRSWGLAQNRNISEHEEVFVIGNEGQTSIAGAKMGGMGLYQQAIGKVNYI